VRFHSHRTYSYRGIHHAPIPRRSRRPGLPLDHQQRKRANPRPDHAKVLPQCDDGLEHRDDGYTRGLDDSVKRTKASAAVIICTDPNAQPLGGTHFFTPAPDYRDHRIRIAGWLKTENVERWAGLDVNVADITGRIYAHDDMSTHPIHGTTDWTRYESVVDVPAGAIQIVLGANLYRTGKVWCDGFTIETVDNSIPTTDDQNW